MQQVTLGKTGLNVSKLGLGGLYTSDLGGGVQTTVDILRAAFSLGINFIDTAPAYANSEQTLGQALRNIDHPPQPLILSTKLGGRPAPFNPQDADALKRSVDESLEHLGRSHIDLLIIHEPDRPGQYNWWSDPHAVDGPVLGLLAQLKDQGLIKYTGVGGTTVNEMLHVIRSQRFEVLLTAFNYSVLYREAIDELIPTAKSLGMGIIAGSILQQGGLGRRYDQAVQQRPPWMSRARQAQLMDLYQLLDDTGISLPELGLRFAMGQPMIDCILTGAKNADQLRQTAASIDKGPLPKAITDRLDELAARLPHRPFEEPMVLPLGKPYFGPGRANTAAGAEVGR